jgi:hypothetical protein
MRGRFLTRTSSTIMLAFAGALAMATLATAAAPAPNLNVTAMPGNEAENAIAVNPTNPSNIVAMSTLPDVVAGLAVGVSFDDGHTWLRRVIGAAGDPARGNLLRPAAGLGPVREPLDDLSRQHKRQRPRRALHRRRVDVHKGRRRCHERRPAFNRSRVEQRLGQLHAHAWKADPGIRSGYHRSRAVREFQCARERPQPRERRLRRHRRRAGRPGDGDLPECGQRPGRSRHLHGCRPGRPGLGRFWQADRSRT